MTGIRLSSRNAIRPSSTPSGSAGAFIPRHTMLSESPSAEVEQNGSSWQIFEGNSLGCNKFPYDMCPQGEAAFPRPSLMPTSGQMEWCWGYRAGCLLYEKAPILTEKSRWACAASFQAMRRGVEGKAHLL